MPGISSGSPSIPKPALNRPAAAPPLVLSPKVYNARSGLALACPITSHPKGYPFEVALPDGSGITGVILADHVKSIDWKARQATRLGPCPRELIEEVRAKLAPLLGY